MELCLVKKETYGILKYIAFAYLFIEGHSGTPLLESKIIGRYEILDGGPIRGETVPIRFHLSSVEGLTPSFVKISNKFSCRYYVNIIIYDEDNKRYFNQHEIGIWRKAKAT